MKIKHKLLSDYQFLSPDKKIFLIKSGTIIEEYIYKVKGDSISIDKEVVDANPQIFQIIDWKAELLSYMKAQKIPTPAQLHKKMIPFIEEMVLSSISNNTTINLDESKIKEIEWKEIDLNNREKRIRDKEEEIDIRLKRVEKREDDHKLELKELDKKEDDLRSRSRELTEKFLDLEDKMGDLNNRERNLDRSLLESSKELDQRYVELQSKIDSDIKKLTEKENELEILQKELMRKEESLLQRESDLEEVEKLIKIKIDEINLEEESLMKLDGEIKNWENMHWKFQRNNIPPSSIPETISESLKARFPGLEKLKK
jgi:DNA repair exonuclease SbcCD ATPase subunit